MLHSSLDELVFFLVIALAKVQLFLDIELENHIFDIKLLIFDLKLRRCIHNMLHVSLIIDHERRRFLDVESWIQKWFVLFKWMSSSIICSLCSPGF